jgi:hypothetical protein
VGQLKAGLDYATGVLKSIGANIYANLEKTVARQDRLVELARLKNPTEAQKAEHQALVGELISGSLSFGAAGWVKPINSTKMTRPMMKLLQTTFGNEAYYYQPGIRGLTLTDGRKAVGAVIELSQSSYEGIKVLGYKLRTPQAWLSLATDGTIRATGKLPASISPEQLVKSAKQLLSTTLHQPIDKFEWLRFQF